ncbi:MAG TPA: DUF1549 domain-containing protein [Pirellulales bacterium]|jgi:hypothetical protein|nr:DUF1549 domain-containing protein [Pirellulales bacterium]
MNDRILDLCLEEAFGGAQPPDLADKIVAALTQRAKAGEADREPSRHVGVAPRPVVVPSVPPVIGPAQPAVANGAVTVAAKPSAGSLHRTYTWLPLALAASLLVVIGGTWAVLSRVGSQKADLQVAGQEPESSAESTGKNSNKDGREEATSPGSRIDSVARDATQSPSSEDEPAPVVAQTSEPGSRQPEALTAIPTAPPGDGALPGNAVPPGNRVAASATAGPNTTGPTEIDASTAGDAVAASSVSDALSTSATTDAEIIAFIDASLKTGWKEAGVRSSLAATESEWCRRVYLDTIGRIPTVDELEAFLVDNSRNKRQKLVDRLLEDDRYVESYARFWTTIWTNLLIGRKGGMEPNSPVNREGLEQYLRRSFLSNKPYNRLVYELLSAKGANRPGETDYNGAVNFLLAHLQERATPATAKTAQIFLGVQVQCTQCHNHPFNDWKQNRFWEMNSFFRQVREERLTEGNQLKLVRLTDADFAGEGGDPREAEVYYELRNGILQVAYPRFIDGTAIDPNGLVSQVDRRRELARFVVRSDEMRRAIVNRLWAHFLGYGFTKPIDDLGPHNSASHPELFARLADEFGGHGYDLKRLIRWITLSEAYALSSRFGPKLGNQADDPTMGTPPLFSHFYVRQMSAEQLYDSLLAATGAHRTQGSYEEQQRLKDQWLEQFAIAFGTDENDEATTFDGTITQTLVMMNGELTRKATSGETGSFLSQVSREAQSNERAKALNELYLAALARRPSRAEVQVANNLLTVQSGNALTALEDIWWALLNSNEFILQH